MGIKMVLASVGIIIAVCIASLPSGSSTPAPNYTPTYTMPAPTYQSDRDRRDILKARIRETSLSGRESH
jgi:hypothetical protein